ncbi:MAG: 3alpha(or 20beta)-hydroxysteroid dehydrogenase [Pseudonocardiales bacterium]|nr:3alpha(or 20beta)-hydroxysteroid dehydrogenase [Pseudonocardiales bacterium]
MGKLDGKVALISGAARGQGEAEARLFAAEGASVVLGDVLEDAVVDVAKSLDSAVGLRLDVTDQASWAEATEAARSEFGRLDILINNAGVAAYSPIAQASVEHYMRIVEINQLGTFLGMRAAIPLLVEAGGGAIVNISSIAGQSGNAGTVAYTASKFAVRGMSKVAALELASAGIRVNSVYPGSVDTPMLQPDALGGALIDMSDVIKGIPMKRMALAEEVARMVLFLASDDSSYCTGGEFVIDGGVLAGQAASDPS